MLQLGISLPRGCVWQGSLNCESKPYFPPTLGEMSLFFPSLSYDLEIWGPLANLWTTVVKMEGKVSIISLVLLSADGPVIGFSPLLINPVVRASC